MRIHYLALDIRRQLTNVRALVFTFVLPVAMLLVFGLAYGSGGAVDHVTHLPWLVITTVQMAGYGALTAGLSQAMTIVNERSLGWNRQLRITSLSGIEYLASKVLAALVVAAVSILITFTVSVTVLHTTLAPVGWLLAFAGLCVGVIPFALIAVLIGLYARSDFTQPLFTVVLFGMAILGGLWIPLQVLPVWASNIAQIVPAYWLERLGLMGASTSGDMLHPALVLGAWTVLLGAIVVWRYRRDAARA